MFKNVSINQKLWSFELGDCKVVSINKKDKYFMATNGIEIYCYKFNGIHGYNVRPTIFWSEPEISEKPFNLEDELKKLEIQEFCCGEENFHLYWDNEEQEISIRVAEIFEEPLCVYFNKESVIAFQEEIKNKKITKEEFFTAYKNVFGGRNAN